MITGRMIIPIVLYLSAGLPEKSYERHCFHIICRLSLYQSLSNKNIPNRHLHPASLDVRVAGDTSIQTGLDRDMMTTFYRIRIGE